MVIMIQQPTSSLLYSYFYLLCESINQVIPRKRSEFKGQMVNYEPEFFDTLR